MFGYAVVSVGGGGGGGGALKVTLTLVSADGLPALSHACASIRMMPDARIALAIQSASPAAVYHPPPETRTFTTRRPLPPESEAIPVTAIDETFAVAPSGGDVSSTSGGNGPSCGGGVKGNQT